MNSAYKISNETPLSVCEQSETWGGKWTEEKLNAFEKYVKAYLVIMGKYAPRFNWKLIYFDGFAGSGSRNETKEDMQDSFFTELTTDEEISIYKGSAKRVLEIDGKKFDFYYFVDTDTNAQEKLKALLNPYKSNHTLIFRNGDANVEVRKMAEKLKNDLNLAALVLLDPFGMQLDWDSIKSLKDAKHIDLWILVPSGVIINRLLDRKGELSHSEKLSKFWGLTEDEIREYFYEKKTIPSLFDEDTEEIHKKEKSIELIAELYVKRLKTIFKFVNKPLALKNSRNCTIFHFIFASNNETATKIANDIIGKGTVL